MNPQGRTRRIGTMGPLELAPAGTSPQRSAIRRRLMERIADADQSHLTIDGSDGEWRPFFHGVAIKLLHERAGVLSDLLRLEPGAVLSPPGIPLTRSAWCWEVACVSDPGS